MNTKPQKKATKKKVAKFIVDFAKELGSGQYGKVYQATDTENNEIVAVKVIEKKLCTRKFIFSDWRRIWQECAHSGDWDHEKPQVTQYHSICGYPGNL